MPARAARQKNAIPAAAPVAGGSRLEQLPAELTQSIFDFLYIFDAPYQPHLIRPLSKHLYPYSTAALYRRIKITTLNGICQLCAGTYAKATLAALIQELDFYMDRIEIPIDVTSLAFLSKLVEVLLCTSSINLRTLKVAGWNLIGRVVLSERFGKRGGKALERIDMIFCFESIEGSIITALGHLRHLPRLSHLEYTNRSVTVIEGDENPPNLGGFEQLKTLKCGLDDLSSPHAIQLASLFSVSKLETVQLVSLNKTIRPNFAILDSLPATIKTLQLSDLGTSDYLDSVQHPLSLTRFHKLQKLQFIEGRIFDEELVDQLITLSSHSLVYLVIFRKCQITFQLLSRFLSRLNNDSRLADLFLSDDSIAGTIGLSYKNGAIPVVENNILVPGVGWKRPDWTSMTLLEAQELARMCIEKGVGHFGSVDEALKVEAAFAEEVKWLEHVMSYMRTGPVPLEATV